MPSTAEMSEVVRRAYDAFNRRDAAAFCELSTPDIEIQDLSDMPGAETLRGYAGIERFFEDNWDTFEDVWGEVERILEAGPDRVLALASHGGTARGGPRIAQARGVLVTFSETGKMKQIRFFGDPHEALTAAGLHEQAAG
jgi:ketosteroid isomerase-like protein